VEQDTLRKHKKRELTLTFWKEEVMKALLDDNNNIVGYYGFNEEAGKVQTVCPNCATEAEAKASVTEHDVMFNDAYRSAVESWEKDHPEDTATLNRCDRCKKTINWGY
jgi:hypothetical protein